MSVYRFETHRQVHDHPLTQLQNVLAKEVQRENPGKVTEFHKKLQSSILRGNLNNFKFQCSGLLYRGQDIIDAIFVAARFLPHEICYSIWSFLDQCNLDFDINECILYPRQESPLMLAALYGRLEMVRLLLASPKVDVNVVNKNFGSVLTRALQNFNVMCTVMDSSDNTRIRILKLLLSHDKLDVMRICLYASPHLMYDFVDTGCPDLIRLLLSRPEIDLSACGAENVSILMHAITNTYPHTRENKAEVAVRMVETILEFPFVDVNGQTERTMTTALMYAVLREKTDIVRLLLQRPEIDKTIRDRKNRTAFDIAQDFPNIRNIFLEFET